MTTRSRTILLLLLCTVLAHAKADGIECGSLVTTSVKLKSDIGPCPGPGLIVRNDDANTNITFDLNGHKITGQGAGIGIKILIAQMSGSLTIKGPGEINGFETGVEVTSTSGYVVIYDLTLRDNRTGMHVGEPTLAVVRVLNNTIIAGRNGSVGVASGGRAYIYQNTISGHSESGIRLGDGFSVVTENLLTQNRVGIGPSVTFDRTCFVLRGNRVVSNLSDGINVLNGLNPIAPSFTMISGPCFQIEDNIVNANGGNGIVVKASGDIVLQNNIVQGNRTNGVMVTSNYVNPAVIKVFGNRSQSNGGTDLQWDPTNSPGVCGMQNIVDKQVQPLPFCLP